MSKLMQNLPNRKQYKYITRRHKRGHNIRIENHSKAPNSTITTYRCLKQSKIKITLWQLNRTKRRRTTFKQRNQ